MKTYMETLEEIRDNVRRVASALPSTATQNGCIRITFCPLCEEANAWANGMTYNPDDRPEYEAVFTMHPSGSHTVTEADGTTINCYGFSALKVASCSHNRAKHGIRLSYSNASAHNPQIIPQNGYANYPGCVCYTIVGEKIIHKDDFFDGESTHAVDYDWARIYIAVSGGTSQDDTRAANAAHSVLSRIFGKEKNFRIV